MNTQKNRRRFLAMLAVLAVLLACAPAAAADVSSAYVPQETTFETLAQLHGETSETRTVPSGATEYYYAQLSRASKVVYDAILSSPLGDGPSTVTVGADFVRIPVSERTFSASFTVHRPVDGGREYISSDDCSAFTAQIIDPAMCALIFDHPELSWLRNVEYTSTLIWRSASGFSITGMKPGEEREYVDQTLRANGINFRITEAGYAWATQPMETQTGPDRYSYAQTGNLTQFNQALMVAKNSIGTLEGMAPAEKVRAVHDWICTHLAYADETGERFLNDWRGYQTAYSALVEGTTVCAGYAAACKLLCDAYDIPCVVVRGADDEGGSHVWNYVNLDSAWYGVDCTWDDLGDRASYEFFLRGRSAFMTGGSGLRHVEAPLYEEYTFVYPELAEDDYEAPAPVQPQETPTPEPESTQAPTPAVSEAPTAEPSASAAAKPFWPPLKAREDAAASFRISPDPNGSGSILTGFQVGTTRKAATAETLSESAIVPDGTAVRIVGADRAELPSESVIATGQRVQVVREEDGMILWQAPIVVSGDVTGSGLISLTQLVRMGRELAGSARLRGLYRSAADLSGDGDLTITDLVLQAAALSHVLGKAA